MKLSIRTKLVAGAAVLGTAAALAAGGLFAAASVQADEQTGKPTMAELAEEYPLQYDSFNVLKTKDGTSSYEGHGSLGIKMLAPIQRDGNTIVLDAEGDMSVKDLAYDEETGRWYLPEGAYSSWNTRTDSKGCYSCKTSLYTDILGDDYQAAASERIDQPFIEAIEGQIFDCYLCHADSPESPADYTIALSEAVLGDQLDELPQGARVCAQCHQSSYHAPMFASGIAWEDYQPFADGFDVDSVLAAEKAAGYGSTEEATGITTYRTNHADVEVWSSSVHASLGVTCVDCHMPTVVDPETGVAYTDHNASGSPLEREESLEYCLTCHAGQGIGSTDEMVEMVRTLQDETAATVAGVNEKLATLHGLIEQAVAGGTVDETVVEQACEAYTTAKFYSEWGLSGNGCGMVKVVHNADLIASLQVRAEALLDEAIALF